MMHEEDLDEEESTTRAVSRRLSVSADFAREKELERMAKLTARERMALALRLGQSLKDLKKGQRVNSFNETLEFAEIVSSILDEMEIPNPRTQPRFRS